MIKRTDNELGKTRQKTNDLAAISWREKKMICKELVMRLVLF
jgi:hypothetical protein